MDLKLWLLMSFVAITTGNFICSDEDCHECIGNTCNLSCLGKSCQDCSNGDCCNGSNCNVCIESLCCSTETCNQCVKKQRKLCTDGTFSSQCSTTVAKKCELNFYEHLLGSGNSYTGHHNITTIIKIRNLINNTNLLRAPIELNLTNTNDMINKPSNGGSILLKSLEGRRKSCCTIVHPQECHIVSNLTKKICFTRRHTECSDLCNYSTNLLITTSRSRRCIYIAVHPYYYCGYYELQDCSACFNCPNTNKIQCLEESACNRTCRSSVLPIRFYNVPYSIKT